MGEQNKILDVTYGSFSCRLEGFENSVETLMAVVSYFQEIGGDDTFVKDPPRTPDLETLASLAAAKNGGTVEVESDGEHLSLRVSTTEHTDDDAQAEPDFETDHAASFAPFGKPDDAYEDEDDSEIALDNVFADVSINDEDDVETQDDANTLMLDADDLADNPTADNDLAPEIRSTPSEHAEQQASVADKLQRIRAVVGRGRTAEGDDSYAEDPGEIAPAAANPLAQRLAELAKRNSATADADTADDTAQPLDSAPLQLSEDDQVDAADTLAEDDQMDAAPEQNDPESGADDIAIDEIADAVSGLMDDDDAPEAADEGEDADPVMDAVEDAPDTDQADQDLDETSLDDDLTEDDLEETIAASEVEDERTEAVAEDDAEDDVDADDMAANDDDAEPMSLSDDDMQQLQDEDVAEGAEADADADADAALEDEQDIASMDEEDGPEDEDAVFAAPDTVEDDVLEEDTEDLIAAADYDTFDIDTSEDDDIAQDADDATTSEIPETTSTESQPLLLKPHGKSKTRIVPQDDDEDDDDDDFDLHKEVEELRRELEARPGNELARHGLPRSVEDAMSRILMETNQHLDEPESRRHRDAFAQLKAAVAATEAARQLGDSAKSRDIGELYKNDFGALEAAENEKDASGPALKLVTDDDTVDDVQSGPMGAATARLRQIAAEKETSELDKAPQNFATFAKSQGAKELADLLEAAAAYISFVDGDADFSRPQVMKVAQTAAEAEITREDGLRSFGRLLRQSRIIKLNNGRFQVSDTTRFKPTSNRAARG